MAEEKEGFFKRIGRFFGEVRQEVRKVSWLSRSELYGGTIVILFMTIAGSLFLGSVDSVFGFIVEVIMAN